MRTGRHEWTYKCNVACMCLARLGTVAMTICAPGACAVAQQVLPGPEAAARAAAAAPNKKRQEAEAAIAKAVSDALHLLGLLRATLPLMTGVV